jgi:hypothetical protein
MSDELRHRINEAMSEMVVSGHLELEGVSPDGELRVRITDAGKEVFRLLQAAETAVLALGILGETAVLDGRDRDAISQTLEVCNRILSDPLDSIGS